MTPQESWHRVSEVDVDARTLTCTICGANSPAWFREYTGRWQCLAGKNESFNKALLKWKYAISPEEWAHMFHDQGARCAICHKTEPGPGGWHTDHDHRCCPGVKSCGTCLRGILCSSCSRGIGLLQEDPVILKAAIAYLKPRKRAL